MNAYLVSVKVYAPYPIGQDYRIEASNFAVATRRAISQYRKEKIAKRKIKEVLVKCTRL